MDEQLYGPCPSCKSQIDQPLGMTGLCHWHTAREEAGRPTAILRSIRPVRSRPAPKSEADILLQEWYDRRIPQMTGTCWECGHRIAVWNPRYAKAAISHILAKEFFPSVQTNDWNFLELGAACGCHKRWDKNWESAQQMEVFPRAVERFQFFESAIAKDERRRLPECLLKILI